MPVVRGARTDRTGARPKEWIPEGDAKEHSITVPIGGNIPPKEIEQKIAAALVENEANMTPGEIAKYIMRMFINDQRLNPLEILRSTGIDEARMLRASAQLRYLLLEEQKAAEETSNDEE